ncbi:MAG: protelomerase family protein [Pseudomonadota bacterium]
MPKTRPISTAFKYADQMLQVLEGNHPACKSETKAEEVVAQIRRDFSSLAYQRRMIYEVRRAVLSMNARDPRFYEDLKALAAEVEQTIKAADADDAAVVRERFRAFRTASLTEQIRYQAATRRDLGPLFPGDGDAAARLNKLVLDMHIEPACLAKLRPPADLKAELDRRESEQLLKKSSSVLVLPGATVRGLYEWALSILRRAGRDAAHDAAFRGDLAVALALVTGRRMSELLLTGVFHPVPGKKHVARFSGQLKKTGLTAMAAGAHPVEYNIPLLAPVVMVRSALRALRRAFPLPENATPQDVNSRYCHVLARAVKARMDVLLGDAPAQDACGHFRFHRLREIYAIVSFDACRPRGKTGVVVGGLSLHEHVRRVCGHKDQNISARYAKMQIDGDPGLRVEYP